MRVYIACHHPDPANEVAGYLEMAGHRVVSSWHRGDARPADDDATAWEVKTVANEAEIDAADVLVVVASPEHVARTTCVPGGKFVEAGYARGRGKVVVTVGGVENGAIWHPATHHVPSGAALVGLLGTF